MSRPRSSPFRKLAIGESVLIPGKTSYTMRGTLKHLHDMRFQVRTVSVSGQIACRVTRVEFVNPLDRLHAKRERALEKQQRIAASLDRINRLIAQAQESSEMAEA